MTTQQFLQLVRAAKDSDFGPGCSETEIAKAQQQLGVVFPNSYASFLQHIGWANIMHNYLYGIGKAVPTHLDLVKITAEERELAGPSLPQRLVPIMNDGAGNHYCLDTEKVTAGECPVVFWDHEHELGERQRPEVVATDFASWLLREIKEWEAA